MSLTPAGFGIEELLITRVGLHIKASQESNNELQIQTAAGWYGHQTGTLAGKQPSSRGPSLFQKYVGLNKIMSTKCGNLARG